MPSTLTVPRLGMGNTGGLIAEWYIQEGASVAAGEPVFRLESDFVSLDIEAEAPGVVRHVVPAGIPQFEGGVVGFVLAPGERMPKVEGMDDWDEVAGADDWDQDPAAAAFTGAGGTHGFGAIGYAENEPIPLRPRRHTNIPDESRPGLWEQITDERDDGRQPRTAPHPLVMRVAIPMTEAAKLRDELIAEWSEHGLAATDELLVVRAAGHALAQTPALQRFGGDVELVSLTPGGRTVHVVNRPAGAPLLEVARALAAPAAESSARASVVSYTAFAIDSAEPGLAPGKAIVISVARPVVTTAVALTLVYDPEQVDDHDAAAFLSRVRMLLVEPGVLLDR